MSLTPRQAAEAALAAAVAAAGWTGRAYVAVSLPALDCEQITAHVAAIARASSTAGFAPLGSSPSSAMDVASLIVQISVCYPQGRQGRPPPAGDLTAASGALLDAGWRVWRALSALDFGDGCRAQHLGPGTPIPDQGGHAGWSVQVDVAVDGPPGS